MRWRFSIQQWTSTHLVTVGSWTKLFCPQWTCGQNLWTVWRMASRPADGSRIKLCNSACVQFIFQTLAKDLVLWVTTSLRDHSPHYLSWQQMQLRQLDWPGGERSGRFSWTLLASEVTEVLPDTKTIICIGWKSSLETSLFFLDSQDWFFEMLKLETANPYLYLNSTLVCWIQAWGVKWPRFSQKNSAQFCNFKCISFN